MWIENIISPLGMRIGRGSAVGRLSVHGLVAVRKFPVVPESTHANSVVATKLTLGLIKLQWLLILLSLGCFDAVGRHSSQPLFHWEPPMVSALVAAGLWPAARFLQVQEVWSSSTL